MVRDFVVKKLLNGCFLDSELVEFKFPFALWLVSVQHSKFDRMSVSGPNVEILESSHFSQKNGSPAQRKRCFIVMISEVNGVDCLSF